MYKKSSRILLVTLLLFVLAGASYAFAATNTVPASFAGDGSGTISGYTVTNVHYVLAASPVNIASVTFTLSNAAADVRISLDGTTYVTCANSSGNNWSCTVSGISVLSATNLRVIAVE